MISRGLLLLPAIVLATPGLLRAQEETKKIDPFKPFAASGDTMSEDIEIFRRILDRQLAPFRQQVLVRSVQLSGSDSSLWATIDDSLSSLEGVYLTGHGVVYTATLSSLEASAKVQANEWKIGLKLDRPVSEWESIRRQLRNEKEEPKKLEARKPPALSDVLLKVLAENGHHFSSWAKRRA